MSPGIATRGLVESGNTNILAMSISNPGRHFAPLGSKMEGLEVKAKRSAIKTNKPK